MYKNRTIIEWDAHGEHEFPQKFIKTTTITDMNSKETVRTSEEGGNNNRKKNKPANEVQAHAGSRPSLPAFKVFK